MKIGREHTYLGVDITFTEDGNVEIRMEEYVKELIEAFGEELGSARTPMPVKKNLFSINPESERLCKKKSDLFHHIVAKLLYVSKRCCLDIQLVVSFLCTRVSCSTKEDWLKLRQLLSYFQRISDHWCRYYQRHGYICGCIV